MRHRLAGSGVACSLCLRRQQQAARGIIYSGRPAGRPLSVNTYFAFHNML